MAEVKWATTLFSKADAPTVAQELNTIETRTPDAIVRYAREHEGSELHKCFTWDDTEAAEKWRKQEARILVCNLVYHEEPKKPGEEPKTLRVFYQTSRDADSTYEPLKLIVKDADRYRGMLDVALRELRSFQKKYSGLKELNPVFTAINQIAI